MRLLAMLLLVFSFPVFAAESFSYSSYEIDKNKTLLLKEEVLGHRNLVTIYIHDSKTKKKFSPKLCSYKLVTQIPGQVAGEEFYYPIRDKNKKLEPYQTVAHKCIEGFSIDASHFIRIDFDKKSKVLRVVSSEGRGCPSHGLELIYYKLNGDSIENINILNECNELGNFSQIFHNYEKSLGATLASLEEAEPV